MILYYLLILALPFYYHPIFNRQVGGLTVIKIMGGACALVALFYVLSRGVTRYLDSRQAKLFLALTGLALLSWLRTRGANLSGFDPALSYISLLLFFFITVSLVDSPQKIRRTLLASIASIGLASMYVLREFQLYGGAYQAFRPGYVVGDPNYFTLTALLVAPVAFFIYGAEPKNIFRWGIGAALVTVSLAITLAASRGGLVGLLVFFAFALYRSRNRLRNVFLLSALLVPPMLVMPNSPLVRLFNPGPGDEISTQSRLDVLNAGLEMVRDHPLFGVGLGQFKPIVSQYIGDDSQSRIAHNTYLEYAAELGLVALLLFLWLLWETYRALGRIQQTARRLHDLLLYRIAVGLQGGLVAFAVGAFFLSAQYQKLFWFYVFLTIPLMRLARERLAQAAPAPAQAQES